MELLGYIEEIAKAKPLRLVFSNKYDKNYDYKKVKVNLVSAKGKDFYQLEKFTDKQVFHENIDPQALASCVGDLLKSFRQLTAMSNDFNSLGTCPC